MHVDVHAARTPSYRLYVRYDATVNGNGGGGTGNGGGDSATVDTRQVIRCSSRTTRTPRRTPRTATTRSPCTPRSTGRSRTARAGSSAGATTTIDSTQTDVAERQRRPARARPRRRQRRRDARARLRRVAGRGGRRGRGLARHEVRQDARRLQEGLEALRRLAEQAAGQAQGARQEDRRRARRRVLPERERAQGVRGQDVPRRDRREPRVAVGPGGLGRRSRTTPTSARTARCSGATSTRRGRACMADGDRETARDATLFLFEHQQLPDGSMPRNSLVNGKTAPDSFNTQLDECAYPILMAYQLGLERRVAVREPHQAGRELRRLARPVVRARALGGAGRLLAVDDRRRDRRPRRRGGDREAQPRRRLGERSGSASPTTTSARSRAGR